MHLPFRLWRACRTRWIGAIASTPAELATDTTQWRKGDRPARPVLPGPAETLVRDKVTHKDPRAIAAGLADAAAGLCPLPSQARPNVHYSVLRKVVSGGVARGLAAGRSDIRRHAEVMTSVSVRTFRTFMPNSSSTRVPGGTPSHFRRHRQAPHRGRKQKSPPKRGSPRPVLKLQLPYSRPSTTESAFSNFLGPPRRTVKFAVAGSRIEDTLMSRNSAANAAPTQRRATSDSVAPPQDLRPTP